MPGGTVREPILIARNKVGRLGSGSKPKNLDASQLHYAVPNKLVTESEDEMTRFETPTPAVKLTLGRG
jgi:hypothetical protein